jgi:hypothetical protein
MDDQSKIRKVTKSEIQVMRTLSDQGLSYKEIGRQLGRSDSVIRRHVKSEDGNSYDGEVGSIELITKLSRANARLSSTNSQLAAQNRKLSARGFGFDDFIESIQELVKVEKLNPLTYFPTQIKVQKNRAAVPAVSAEHSEIVSLALSDWHITETVRLEDSNGINEYNSMICSNRLWEVVQKFKQIVRIHQAAYKIKSIWLPTLGDMLSGSVHPEFLTTNDTDDPVAVLLCARMFEMLILEIKSLGIEVFIDCVVGNHPRTTHKVPTKRLAHTNLDWLVYMVVEMMFRNDPQVHFKVHTSQLAICEQFNHRYVIEHGIQWKNGHEEEFEDRIRAILDSSEYRKATGLKGTAFDQVVIGNLHKPAFLERTIKNGSLIGQNELGQQWRLKPIKAQQLMWGISRSHVRTFGYGVDVTEVKSSKVENPFSEFAHEFLKKHGRHNL